MLLSCVPAGAYAQSKPLVTQFLECVQDNKGRDVGSRSMQTPVFDSNQGLRAYGVVVSHHSPDGACNNTSTIYVAEPAGTFQLALQQTSERLPDGTVYDGNGIEGIQWSPSGTRLLIQVSQWASGTDSTWNTRYILLTGSKDSAKELRVEGAVQRYFTQPCARLIRSKGWLDDTRIDIEINPYKSVDEEGTVDTPSCVRTARSFSFDVDSGDFRERR